MKAVLEKVPSSPTLSFFMKEEILPYIKIGWHFHPEFELTAFTKSTGKKLIGDHLGRFQPGDVYLIGPSLPHYMRNDDLYYQGQELQIRALVVHFSADFLGSTFFLLPELRAVQQLLQAAGRGLHLQGELANSVSQKMEVMLRQEGLPKLMGLIQILSDIADSGDYIPLASVGFQNLPAPKDSGPIGEVYQYLFEHFSEDISLENVSHLANMTPSAFSADLLGNTP
ncbi:MAG: cupin domain-containing protein [Bacteroidota bacterium]